MSQFPLHWPRRKNHRHAHAFQCITACLVALSLGACAMAQESPQVEINPAAATDTAVAPELETAPAPAMEIPVPDEVSSRTASLPAARIFRHVPRNSYTAVNPEANVIALTFDDGPHKTLTPKLLDILKSRNVRATFYVLGSLVQAHPDIARRIVAEGHEIANHTWTHPYLSRLSREAVRRELQRTEDIILEVTGVKPTNYRPPYGAITAAQKQWIYEEFGYPTIMWDVDPLDWRRPGASVVAQRILDGTRKGSIVLAHDIHPGTIEAMPATIDGLKARGFQFLTVKELLLLDRTAVEITSAE